MSRLEIHSFAPCARGDRARTVRVWIPDAYDGDSNARWPVLYLHDGQNVFDRGEHGVPQPWGVDSVFERGIRAGTIPPWIVVGFDHAGPQRLSEYSPWDEPRAGVRAGIAAHERFVMQTLCPWVDRTYRTVERRGARAIGGSSMGGLASLWLAHNHDDVFARVLAMSPTTMWGGDELARRWRTHANEPMRIYLDAGARERFDTGTFVLDYARSTRAFGEHLRSIGYGPDELRVVLEPAGDHDERSWRRRLPDALAWLLGSSDP